MEVSSELPQFDRIGILTCGISMVNIARTAAAGIRRQSSMERDWSRWNVLKVWPVLNLGLDVCTCNEAGVSKSKVPDEEGEGREDLHAFFWCCSNSKSFAGEESLSFR